MTAEGLNKPETEVYYLPIHVVHKKTSSTTKVRAVLDASSSGVSLTFLVGTTIHPPLVDSVSSCGTYY